METGREVNTKFDYEAVKAEAHAKAANNPQATQTGTSELEGEALLRAFVEVCPKEWEVSIIFCLKLYAEVLRGGELDRYIYLDEDVESGNALILILDELEKMGSRPAIQKGINGQYLCWTLKWRGLGATRIEAAVRCFVKAKSVSATSQDLHSEGVGEAL